MARKGDIPFRRFAMNTISAHRARGYEVRFKPMELVEKILREGVNNCPLCGEKYIWVGAKRVRRNSPSLDRILPKFRTRIMTLKNVRLICHWCNLAKGELNIREFKARCRRIANA